MFPEREPSPDDLCERCGHMRDQHELGRCVAWVIKNAVPLAGGLGAYIGRCNCKGFVEPGSKEEGRL